MKMLKGLLGVISLIVVLSACSVGFGPERIDGPFNLAQNPVEVSVPASGDSSIVESTSITTLATGTGSLSYTADKIEVDDRLTLTKLEVEINVEGTVPAESSAPLPATVAIQDLTLGITVSDGTQSFSIPSVNFGDFTLTLGTNNTFSFTPPTNSFLVTLAQAALDQVNAIIVGDPETETFTVELTATFETDDLPEGGSLTFTFEDENAYISGKAGL